MLTRLRSRLRHPFIDKDAEDGFTLIEAVVAMFVFTIVSLAILSGVILTRTVSSDAQARQTASNLAAAAINVARTTQNLNDLDSSTSTQTVAGRSYTVTTTARWAPSNTGATTQCSTGTGAVLGKSVEVTVSWSGSGATATPVTLTTMVASTSAVTQVGNGSIMVQVTNAQGQPFSSPAALGIVPVSGSGAATPDSSTVPATIDSQGCAFIPNLVPGSYTVTIGTSYNGSGDPYVDTTNQPQSSKQIGVTANTMSLAAFTYDQSTPVAVTFGPSGALVPVGIQASFVHDNTITQPSGGCLGAAATYCVFPFSNGYMLVAGNLGVGAAPSCESVDPSQWQASAGYAQGAVNPVVTSAGAAVTANAPMGTVALTGLSALIPTTSGSSITISAAQLASPATTDAADPGCIAAGTGSGIAYSFPPITSGDTATLALPYGSWKLTYAMNTPYAAQCTATRSGSSGNYVYKCSSTGTSNPSSYPAPAANSTVPSGASCTSGGYHSSTYTCSWTATATVAGSWNDANVTSPAAPSSYASGGFLTLDPRAAVS